MVFYNGLPCLESCYSTSHIDTYASTSEAAHNRAAIGLASVITGPRCNEWLHVLHMPSIVDEALWLTYADTLEAGGAAEAHRSASSMAEGSAGWPR